MSAVFDGVVGQGTARRSLERTLTRWAGGSGGLHHAYLLTGDEEYPRPDGDELPPGRAGAALRPLGQGQWRLARQLAALILVGGRPDHDDYLRALHGAHPDLQVIEREGDLIRLDQVAALVAQSALRPLTAPRRVWLLDEADKLHAAAANKLLKSLEEPPAYAHFVLATAEPARMLPTIVSRCEVVACEPVAGSEIAAHLRERCGVLAVTADALAALARGSVSRAERLAADEASGRRQRLIGWALGAVHGDEASADGLLAEVTAAQGAVQEALEARLAADLERLAADTADERDLAWRQKRFKERARREVARNQRITALDAFDLLVSVLRDLWVVSTGQTAVLLNNDHAGQLAEHAALPAQAYASMLAVAGATRRDMLLNVDRALALRAMFFRMLEVSRTCAT